MCFCRAARRERSRTRPRHGKPDHKITMTIDIRFFRTIFNHENLSSPFARKSFKWKQNMWSTHYIMMMDVYIVRVRRSWEL